MLPPATLAQAAALLARLQRRGLTLATAESCTGGLIAAALTSVPGSSATVLGGFVSYSNAAKTAMLGVDPALIAAEGAVSEAVARAMAEGALARSGAGIAVSVTGIAGPGGATPGKPVGLVHLAVAVCGGVTLAERHLFAGDRAAVRAASVAAAFDLVARAMEQAR
ncbi:MAG: nicotinamide-nucleotide amidohydrolase family protein [Acetobacteraceae bacterium]|nr:nicotinamide-nucleotide amidohydrolase family protein [Acetobacteraceae bacterium]